MAGGGAAAEAPRRHLHLGGRRRLLPRHGASRRHLLPRLRRGLVEGAGLHRAERPRHPRLQEPHDRRLGVRPRDAVGRSNSPRTAATSTRTACRASSTPTSSGSRACRTGTRSRCRCCRRRIGAGRGCIRAAISRASCARPPSRNGWRCTASSTGRISIRTTASACRRSSSAISSKARTPAGASSPRCSCRCAIRARNSSSGTRANGRSSARSGPSSFSTPAI